MESVLASLPCSSHSHGGNCIAPTEILQPICKVTISLHIPITTFKRLERVRQQTNKGVALADDPGPLRTKDPDTIPP